MKHVFKILICFLISTIFACGGSSSGGDSNSLGSENGSSEGDTDTPEGGNYSEEDDNSSQNDDNTSSNGDNSTQDGNSDSQDSDDGGSQTDTTPPTFFGAKSIIANSTGSLTITWDPANDNQTSASNIVYHIYQAVDNIEGEDFVTTSTYTTDAGATSYTITGLNETTTYFYVVRACDEADNCDTNTTEILVTTKSSDTNISLPNASNNPTLVSYTSQGYTIYSLLYRPSGATNSNPYPVIIYTYGGGGAQNLCSHWHDACDISRGASTGCGIGGGNYVVLVAGMRGDYASPSGDCTLSATSEGSESRWRGDVNDVLPAIEWLKTKDYIDTSRIGIFGESVGGNNALLIAERSPDIKAVSVWFPHVDLAYIYDLYLNDNTINIGWASSALGGCTPTTSDDCAKEYRVRSPINYADRLTMPVQHSHCTSDATVPYQASQVLYDYMDTAGRLNNTYSFYSYDGNTAESDNGNGCLNFNHGPFNQNPWKGLALTRRTNFFDSNL